MAGAADTAKLLASLEFQDKGFSRGLATASGNLGKFESTLGRVGSTAVGGLKTAAATIARIGVVAGIAAVGLLGKAITEASNLNETLNKSQVVFGKASAAVEAFGKTAAASMGLSENEAIAAAASIGNLLLSTGTAPAKIEPMSTAIVKLASDLASFNNIDPAEALQKLQSGLVGQERPLRELGVAISAASVDTEALALGFEKVNGQFTEGQKVQARYSLIFKQTTTAQGDFARTSGGLANQQRILAANLKDTAAIIGTAVLPGVTKLVTKVNELVTEHRGDIENFAQTLPGAFEAVLSFAEKIPWGAVAKGLETGAFFAGKLIEAFTSMPPEVQSTIIALAGLNKLTGGAVSSIVGQLGSGLIKGVLGMNAGVVNINAGVVNGGGLPVPGGKTGLIGNIVKGAAAVTIVGITAEAALQISGINDPQHQTGDPAHPIMRGTNVASDQLDNLRKSEAALAARVAAGETGKVVQQLIAVRNAIQNLEPPVVAALTDAERAADQRESKSIASFGRLGAAITAGLSKLQSVIAGFGYSPSEWQDIYARAAAAGGRSQINALARQHDALKAIALADSETSKFLSGTAGPFFLDGKNQTRLLASLAAGQAYFTAHGDTVTAARLSADIERLTHPTDVPPLPKDAAKADDIRETNRINKQTTSKIDAAKVETSRKIDDTTSAIVTSQTAIVSAIQALASAFHITISASDITKAQKQQQATRPPTVLNRGGAPIAT